MQKIPLFQVDAFTSRVFSGNPAAVCLFDAWPDDQRLMDIAAENNLSETAFLVPAADGYALRWFTAGRVEVNLCGHGTLAAAFVIFSHLEPQAREARFQTQSGRLTVTRDGDWLTLHFPAKPPYACELPEALAQGLGVTPRETWRADHYLAVLDSEEQLRALVPDLQILRQLPTRSVIVTAPSRDFDFVSRYFVPGAGLEDPVTGAAHCTLFPYWGKRLGKQKLHAKQISARGGELWGVVDGDTVHMSGQARLYLAGTISLD